MADSKTIFDIDDDPQPVVPTPPPKAGPPAIPRKMKYHEGVHEICVKLPNGDEVYVPADEMSAKAGLQIMTSEVAALFRDQVAMYRRSKEIINSKTLKDIVDSAEKIDALQRAQFIGAENDKTAMLRGATALGKAVMGLAQGLARTASPATADAFTERFRKMNRVKEAAASAIEADPEPESTK